MSTGLIVTIIVAVIVLILLGFTLVVYNSLVRARNNVKTAFADVDVVLKKRYDLIPNIVNTVKGYTKHEQETLTEVVKLRNSAMESNDINEKVQLNNKLSASLKNLMALRENYPDLKADSSFLSLQKSLVKVEDELSVVRTTYNSVVNTNNTKLDVFPNNMIGNLFGFKHFELFTIVDPKERENVKAEF